MRNGPSALSLVRYLVLPIFSLTSILALSSLCAADGSTYKDDYAKGVRHYEKKEFKDALFYFESSYKKKPTAGALHSIGMCQKELFRYVDSVDTLKQYLVHPKAKPRQSQEAREAIDFMQGRIGHVKIEGAPDGAEVRINGKNVGESPLKMPIRLDPDTEPYVLLVSKEGYTASRQEVTVGNGARLTIKAVLDATKLEVTCSPEEGVTLSIDDGPEVQCPHSQEVTPGLHLVRGSAVGYEAGFEKINVAAGKTATMRLALAKSVTPPEPAPAVAPPPPVPVTPEPTPPAEPTEQKGSPAVLVSGVVITALGIGAAVVGGICTSKYNEAYDDGVAASTRWKQSTGEERDEAATDYNQAGEDMDAYTPGIVAGFVCGGVLITTGVILMGIGANVRRHPKRVSVAPAANGLSVTF